MTNHSQHDTVFSEVAQIQASEEPNLRFLLDATINPNEPHAGRARQAVKDIVNGFLQEGVDKLTTEDSVIRITVVRYGQVNINLCGLKEWFEMKFLIHFTWPGRGTRAAWVSYYATLGWTSSNRPMYFVGERTEPCTAPEEVIREMLLDFPAPKPTQMPLVGLEQTATA